MASIRFKNVYLDISKTISSNNERVDSTYKIGDYFDGEKTVELVEEKLQKKVINELRKDNKIDLLIGSDLSNQLGITNKVASDINIPYLGVYSACSSYIEELILAASLLNSSSIKSVACLVSSHNLDSERTYRYPIEYGSITRNTQTFTATGAVASLITKKETNIQVESATIGKVVDYGVKDANNMGAVMAPGAAETLISHLNDLKRDISYYDIVITGDLGKIGSKLFLTILSKNDITIKKYIDAGSILIQNESLTHQGASGPICLPLVFIEKILKEKKYKRVLLIGTGALFNTTMVNQKRTLPCISHIVSLEVK